MMSTTAATSAGAPAVRRVVRGGSFFDRPARAQAFQRLAYPAWQRVFNVGFRVIVEEPGMKPAAARREVE
jgi:formylglycine-generating enzyme required for sulfatase activity